MGTLVNMKSLNLLKLSTNIFNHLELNPNDLLAISTMYLLIEREDVAPGEGAFMTCIAFSVSAILNLEAIVLSYRQPEP